MPRNAKITSRLRQQWLDLSVGGKLEAAIATGSGYTERAVKEHIERARIERDWRSARLQQMKEALGAHHRDLLGVLDATDRLVMRVTDELLPQDGLVMRSGPVRWEEDVRSTARAAGAAMDEPVGILARDRVDSYPAVRFEGVRAPDVGKEWKIALGNEGWLLWRSLREHLKGSPLWGGLQAWRTAAARALDAIDRLQDRIQRLAKSALEADLSPVTTSGKARITTALISKLGCDAVRNARGDAVRPLTDRVSFRGGRLDLDDNSILGDEFVDRDPSEVIEAFGTVVVDAYRSGEARRAADRLRSAEDAAREVRAIIEGVRYLHFVPGRCRICTQMEGG